MLMIFLVDRQLIIHTSKELLLQQKTFLQFLIVLFLLKELFLLQEDLLPHFAHYYLMILSKHMCVYHVGFKMMIRLSMM